MEMGVILFLAGQAVIIAGTLIATHVRTAVRLKEIEVLTRHSDKVSAQNHSDIGHLKSEVNGIRVKLEHITTMQSMLCATCPLKGQHLRDDGDNKQ